MCLLLLRKNWKIQKRPLSTCSFCKNRGEVAQHKSRLRFAWRFLVKRWTMEKNSFPSAVTCQTTTKTWLISSVESLSYSKRIWKSILTFTVATDETPQQHHNNSCLLGGAVEAHVTKAPFHGPLLQGVLTEIWKYTAFGVCVNIHVCTNATLLLRLQQNNTNT
jgi:hypothetical protein